MKKFIRILTLIGLVSTSNALAYGNNGVIEIYNDCAVSCCSNYGQFSGLYFVANLGRTRMDFTAHRPDQFGLLPLNDGEVRTSDWSFMPAIGFDLYPQVKIPVRFELSYLYTDNKFGFNPLFPDDFIAETSSNDQFRIYNTMATLYLDWHNCSRIIPYLGVSIGSVSKETRHFPHIPGVDNFTTASHDHDAAWGASLGLRMFLSCHFFGNLQYRFSDFKSLRFKNAAPQLVPLPNQTDYLSDFLHENSIFVGIGYQV